MVFCRAFKTDPMVLERETYVRTAFRAEIQQVPKDVVSSWNFANAEQMLVLLTAVISQVFELPGQGAPEGSAEWVQAVFRTDSYTFENLIKHKKLLNKYLRKFRCDLPSNGQLPMRAGEVVPDRDYTRSRSYEYLESGGSFAVMHVCYDENNKCFKCNVLSISAHSSVSYIKHPHLTFLRRVHVQKAITELRNVGLYAFKTSASSMPDGGISVDNFAQFKTVFHMWYCYFEGWIFSCGSSVAVM